MAQRDATAEKDELWQMGLDTIRELETEEGILASGREEIYGCIFGRDSLITGLKLLKAYEKTEDSYFLSVVKKILRSMVALQGKEENLESGEEPGKIIHEYRAEKHEHLTKREVRPWYLYPDGKMRNYDSVDSTPLFLIAASRYIELSRDISFYSEIYPAVEQALLWLLSALERHPQELLSYDFPEERQCGGLATQSWMDSFDSVFHEDDSKVLYPIAPVEAQGYAYLAMKRWSRMLSKDNLSLSYKLSSQCASLKQTFNKSFVFGGREFKIAFAIDGAGKPMLSKRSSPGHLLWMAMGAGLGASNDSILEPIYMPKLVKFILSPDIFEPEAGVRTLSKSSPNFDPASYHNGSIWPHDNAIISEGLDAFGYEREAKRVRDSLRKSWQFFKSPVELFVHSNDRLSEYLSPLGQKACAKQAWSAASMLSEL